MLCRQLLPLAASQELAFTEFELMTTQLHIVLSKILWDGSSHTAPGFWSNINAVFHHGSQLKGAFSLILHKMPGVNTPLCASLMLFCWVQEILSMVLFGSLPQLFDITVSCAYMAAALQPWIALIVFVLLITYIPLRYSLPNSISFAERATCMCCIWPFAYSRMQMQQLVTTNEELADMVCPDMKGIAFAP